MSGRITVTLPLPTEVTPLSPVIAENELFRSLTEIEALVEPDVGAAVEAGVAGAELALVVVELQPAAPSSAATAAAAVSPARADTEYNGVPRLFASTCRAGMCENRSV